MWATVGWKANVLAQQQRGGAFAIRPDTQRSQRGGKSPMTATARKGPSQWALALGYAGLTPFVGLVLAIWFSDASDRVRSVAALVAYGATILSFLGAIHWGLVMRTVTEQSKSLLAWGVVPSLVAWVALLLDPAAGLWLVATALWACFMVDRVVYPKFGVGAWLPMRLALTSIASLSCVAGALSAVR